jgi:uncharacterized membrane protein
MRRLKYELRAWAKIWCMIAPLILITYLYLHERVWLDKQAAREQRTAAAIRFAEWAREYR